MEHLQVAHRGIMDVRLRHSSLWIGYRSTWSQCSPCNPFRTRDGIKYHGLPCMWQRCFLHTTGSVGDIQNLANEINIQQRRTHLDAPLLNSFWEISYLIPRRVKVSLCNVYYKFFFIHSISSSTASCTNFYPFSASICSVTCTINSSY